MSRPAWVPWLRIVTVLTLTTALVLAAVAGRMIEAIIIAVILVPSLVTLGVWGVAWRKDLLGHDR